MKDQQELDAALQQVDETKKALDDSYAKMQEAKRRITSPAAGPLGATPLNSPAVKSWTVKMKDGTVYPGVKAASAEEAARKMMEGPAGVLAPPPFKPAPGSEMPAPAPRTPAGSANFTGLPEAASGAGTLLGGPAVAGAGLASDMLSDKSQPQGPLSGRDIAGDLVPIAVGALSRPSRTVGSAVKTVLGNVLGRGAVEGGIAAAQGEDVLPAAVGGAVKGVLPGLAQAGVGTALGPTRDTLQVQKAAKALKGELSPNLAALIDPNKPATLLSGKTVNALKNAAGTNLDKMEAEVEGLLGPAFLFKSGNAQAPGLFTPQGTPIKGGLPPELMARVMGTPAGQTFAEMRAEIKELRKIGDKAWSSAEASKAAQAAKSQAAQLEQSMLKQMPPDAAKVYQAGIEQHAKDSTAIRWLRDVQKQNSVSGGANPIDRPGLGKAEEAINQKGGSVKAGLHGVLGAAEAMTGRPIGAGYHLGRAADTVRASGGPLRPQQGVPTVVPKISGGLSGVATGGLQSLLLKKLQPQESE